MSFVPLLSWPMLIIVWWWFCFVFLIAVNFLNISVIMSLLFIPFINCSFSHQCCSLYPHSFSFNLRWPIHFLALSFSSVTSLQYCNDKILPLFWGLNFSLNTPNNLVLVVHFSYSSSFRVCTNWSPSKLNQFSVIRTLSLSCILWLLLMKIFSTSVSELYSSW